MVVANTLSGATHHFDLLVPEQLAAARELLCQGQVTALSILCNGMMCSLPRPRRFRQGLVFGVEVLADRKGQALGERIYVQAENVRASLTLTCNSRLIRCDLQKTGRMVRDGAG